MKTTRIKVKIPDLKTRQDAELVMSELATAANSKRKLLADRDAEVLAINQRIQEDLVDLENTIQQKTSALHLWAEANPDEFPKDRKSLSFLDGTIGFRTGNPSVVLASRATSWEKVIGVIRLLRWRRFLRVKCEVDKEAMLARYSKLKDAGKTRFTSKVLGRLGLKIKQEETFYVEPRLTEMPARQTIEA